MASLLPSVFGRVEGNRQMAIIAVGVVATALVFGLSRWATQPTYVPLYANVPIESVGVITDKLTEAGIAFKLENAGGSVLVEASKVATARVALAREALPGGARPGLELFDKPTWGMTDFTQKVNYRRALEGELERNIGTMRNVERVQVHLALEDDKIFKKDARQSKASVTLAMTGGDTPTPETVRGIASLVAGSVGGLEADHVVIIDERGNALTTLDDASGVGLSSRQVTMQRDIEKHLEDKAEALLSQIVGAGNARVQVAATINFDKLERTTQAVNPDQQVVSVEHKSEITPQEGQAGAASTNVATTFETTRSVESFTGAVGDVKKMTVAVLVADKVTITPDADGAAATPPVITPRSAEELTRIEALVRNALGIDTARGDGLSVISAPFDMPVIEQAVVDSVPTPTMVTRVLDNPKPVIAIASLIVLLVIAMVSVRALKPAPVPAPVLMAAAPSNQQALSSGQFREPEPEVDAELALAAKKPVVLPPPATTPEREQAIATVEQRPDAAVRVTRTWLRN
jgi:flagellar M-ring protein FliF